MFSVFQSTTPLFFCFFWSLGASNGRTLHILYVAPLCTFFDKFIQDSSYTIKPQLTQQAAVITAIRYAIYTAFKEKGHSFAKQQMEHAKPEWIIVTDDQCKDNQNKNENNNNNNGNNQQDIRKRIGNEKITQNGIKEHDNDKKKESPPPKELSREDSRTLLTKISDISIDDTRLSQLFSNFELTNRQIKDIKRYRKTVKDYDSSVNKFLEVNFKLIMTVFIMCFGIYVVVLRDSAFWHAETLYTGKNFKPPQYYDGPMLFYYWLSLGYHVHRCFFQFFNHARSDFWAMFIHHWATICLISLSWVSGFCETGCLVMFLHDNGDVWLPLAKV